MAMTQKLTGPLTAACAFFELIGGCATAVLIFVCASPYAGATERLWSLVAAFSVLLQFAAAGIASACLFRRGTVHLHRAVVAAKASAGANLILALVGIAATIAAKRHGGDSAVYAVIGSFVFCFCAPLVLAAIGAGIFAILRRMAK